MSKKSSNPFNEVITTAKNFVEKQKGIWDHTRWENFISDVQKKGVAITKETSNLIGSVFESLKKLYIFSPKTGEVKEELQATTEQPSAGEAKTSIVEKPETPVVKKAETPIVERTSHPLEIKKEPEIKVLYQGKTKVPARKSLHKKPKKVKKHPHLLKQKVKPIERKKKRTGS